jgi:hypothetical protein
VAERVSQRRAGESGAAGRRVVSSAGSVTRWGVVKEEVVVVGIGCGGMCWRRGVVSLVVVVGW